MSYIQPKITPQIYQRIRHFALSQQWENLKTQYNNECKVNGVRDEALFAQAILPEVIRVDQALTQTIPRSTVPVFLDVSHILDEEKPVRFWQRLFPTGKAHFHFRETGEADVIQPNDTYYQYDKKYIHIAFKHINGGLDILLSLEHEGAHVAQDYVTNDFQKQMVAISRALYLSPEEHHQSYCNNYIEMEARLAEAKFLLELLPHVKNDDNWNITERKNFAQQIKECQRKLLEETSPQKIHTLNKGMSHFLRHSSEDCELLHDVFPGNTPLQRNKSAADFLKTNGLAMHLQLYEVLVSVSQQLDMELEKLETEIQNQVHTNMVDDRRKTLTRLQDRNIPFINTSDPNQLPMHAYCLDGHDMNTVESILETVQEKHNVCCALREGLLCVFYDDKEQPRPILNTSVNIEDVTHELSIVKDNIDMDAEYDEEER